MSPRPEEFVHLVYARSVPISAPGRAPDPLLEAGKRHNLALACPAFDGRILQAGEVLSFWDVVGRADEEAGYSAGLDVRGLAYPTVGGGLGLVASALFECAAHEGWRIDERHGYACESVPPAPGELWGVDAHVLWPYVDLRVAPVEGPVRLTLRVGGAGLLLGVYATQPGSFSSALASVDEGFSRTGAGWTRENRILRRTYRRDTGACVREEIVAENARLVLTDEVRRAA